MKKDKDKYPPEYLFWRKRIEGQIRHTMYEHPEFFTKEASEKNMVGSMAKRIIGEIVAGNTTGNNLDRCAMIGASVLDEDDVQCGRALSRMVSGKTTADHPFQEVN